MTAHREAARHPGTEPGVQADSSVAPARPSVTIGHRCCSDGFLDGLGTGWRALVSALGAAVVVLGVLLPWLAVAALVTAGALVLVRLARRRSAVAASPAQPEEPQPTDGERVGATAGP